ncbi:putative metal-binding motif-containing protein [Lujinxingia litoralis]|nr:putative metal-binding motif-containing protein [Lujinxingia litoralis]
MRLRLMISALALLALTLQAAACSVAFDATEEGVYYCESDEDCLAPQFICSVENTCVRRGDINDQYPCIDEDEDGYGAPGTDRRNCPNAQEDCDDTNPDINPGKAEVCDGIDNNCSGDTDVVTCSRDSDCPTGVSDPEGNSVNYTCNTESGVCEARPAISFCPGNTCPECAVVLQCTSGALDITPETCR